MTAAPAGPVANITDSLLGVPPSEYGSDAAAHTLEMYKLYVEMANHISDRRERANSFFLAVNTALVALLAKDVFHSPPTRALELLVPLSAMVLCFLWFRIIRAYKDLNSAKFKIIHAIERRLPIRPYDAEWDAVGRGKDSSLYLPFTHVEIIVPWLFFVFHVLFAVVVLPIHWVTQAAQAG